MLNNDLLQIEKTLTSLEKSMQEEADRRISLLEKLHPEQRVAARNMIHYLSLRNEDIRELQDLLHIHGLSSLASSESHIHRQLQAILERLGKTYEPEQLDSCTYAYSHQQMQQKSKLLFGEKSDQVVPNIMVTFDSSFAGNYALIKNFLLNGMNVARINCAHDDETTWAKMIQQIKRAIRHTGLNCKVYMDLAGPKIRTMLIGKGAAKGKVKIKEGELIWLSETMKGFDKDCIVVSTNEKGIIPMLKKGERVFFDDGTIKCVVETVFKNHVALRIVRNSSPKQQLKAGKGINFPDSEITVQPLTEFDKACLPFICNHADLIGYSFVRNASDLEALQGEINKITQDPPSIIIKIETPEAVKNLPYLLLSGIQQKVFGLMIARGDLAVEIGFERMGEIQEEILWICEAAHVPVIWATQVLESLNKSGMATRSEITDASHAAMAECVMINKGDHTIEVIETLKDILHRTGGHHIKKRFTFRTLSIAESFIEGN